MKEIEMICIQCPLGCKMKVSLDDDDRFVDVTGYTCQRGKAYAIQEITDPQRMIPTNIKVIDGEEELVSVKTSKSVPKRMIWEIMDVIKNTEVKAPVEIGQIIIPNILETGADIIATKPINKK